MDFKLKKSLCEQSSLLIRCNCTTLQLISLKIIFNVYILIVDNAGKYLYIYKNLKKQLAINRQRKRLSLNKQLPNQLPKNALYYFRK